MLTDDVQALTGSLGQLAIIDEALTTYLRPEFINRHQLQFTVNFPHPGKYKIWFTYKYPSQLQQVTYVVDVQ